MRKLHVRNVCVTAPAVWRGLRVVSVRVESRRGLRVVSVRVESRRERSVVSRDWASATRVRWCLWQWSPTTRNRRKISSVYNLIHTSFTPTQ